MKRVPSGTYELPAACVTLANRNVDEGVSVDDAPIQIQLPLIVPVAPIVSIAPDS